MKHLMKCLCVALILMLAAASAMAELNLSMVFQYMPSIKSVPGTNCVLIESKQDNSLGLYTTTGQSIIPCAYKNVEYLGNGFFSACDSQEAVDGKALWTIDGRMIGKQEYGGFNVFNRHWVAAFVVNPEPQNDRNFRDLKIVNKFYQYQRIDLYYVTDEAASVEPVACLDRDAYAEAFIHGEYIAITNRENQVSVYDSSFQSVPVELATAKSPMYKIDKYQLIGLLTQSILGDGITEVAEVNQSDRMLIRVTRIALNGTRLTGLMNPDGSVVLPADYELIDLNDKYAVIADLDKNQGLFSLEEGRLIVPCAYSAIVPCDTDLDKYVHNGYVCVEKDGKLGFYDVANDAQSCETKYSKRAVTNIGCSLFFTTLEGDLIVVAGDGEVNTVDADAILATRGDGYLLEAQKGASFGLIDWHGNIVVPINHYREIIVTDDSQAMIRTSTGMQLDAVTW